MFQLGILQLECVQLLITMNIFAIQLFQYTVNLVLQGEAFLFLQKKKLELTMNSSLTIDKYANVIIWKVPASLGRLQKTIEP